MAAEDNKSEFGDSPSELHRRWKLELDASRKALEDWHTQGDRADKRYKDEREGTDSAIRRRNLYAANIQTQQAMLYGQTPQVSASRRFADAADDVARVGGVLMERMMNSDIERDSDTYAKALQNSLEDWLIPGFGNARVRYELEQEDVPETPAILDEQTGEERAPKVPATKRKSYEDVDVDYIHWKDQLWNAGARTHAEWRWWGHKALMSREQLIERFGDEVGKLIPLDEKKKRTEGEKADPWGQAGIWEIWDKDTKKVYWLSENYPSILDQKEDPLGLEGFFPCPEPMISGNTTAAYIPKPDFELCRDMYNQVDELTTRIDLLVDAVRVAGVYDEANEGLKELLKGPRRNQLIPVKNWLSFSEKGGVRGAIDWLPLEQVVGAISSLREERAEVTDAIYQITGWSDIMRGQATSAGVTATEQSIKAGFGSVRIRRRQDEFARFATDIQRLKAEVISKHFDPETIIERSNAQYMPQEDQQLIQPAIELIKSKLSCYRIEVKPEAINLSDFAALKQERTEVLGAIANFFSAVAPLAAQSPSTVPDLLKMAQWVVAGMRGAAAMEGTFDHMIAAAQQAASAPPQQPGPDPKIQGQLQLQAMKGQADLAKVQAETQSKAQLVQLEVQADAQRESNQREQNVMEHAQKQQISAAFKPPPTFNGGHLP